MCMSAGHARTGCMCRNCGIQLHDWKNYQYYCPYIDGHSSRAFACESCGDRSNCDGEMVQRICSRCGAKEWIYSEDIKAPESCPFVPNKEENV